MLAAPRLDGGVADMLKDTRLPGPLLEFIEAAKRRLLDETETERVESHVELVWVDQVRPSYTHITLYAFGSGEDEWIDGCIEIEQQLNDAKPESLFDCVPGPYLSLRCCPV